MFFFFSQFTVLTCLRLVVYTLTYSIQIICVLTDAYCRPCSFVIVAVCLLTSTYVRTMDAVPACDSLSLTDQVLLSYVARNTFSSFPAFRDPQASIRFFFVHTTQAIHILFVSLFLCLIHTYTAFTFRIQQILVAHWLKQRQEHRCCVFKM